MGTSTTCTMAPVTRRDAGGDPETLYVHLPCGTTAWLMDIWQPGRKRWVPAGRRDCKCAANGDPQPRLWRVCWAEQSIP